MPLNTLSLFFEPLMAISRQMGPAVKCSSLAVATWNSGPLSMLGHPCYFRKIVELRILPLSGADVQWLQNSARNLAEPSERRFKSL